MYQCVVDASVDGMIAAAAGGGGGGAPPATSKMTSGGATGRRPRRRRTARGEAALELGGNTRDWQVAVRPLPRYIGSVVNVLINACRHGPLAYGQLLLVNEIAGES